MLSSVLPVDLLTEPSVRDIVFRESFELSLGCNVDAQLLLGGALGGPGTQLTTSSPPVYTLRENRLPQIKGLLNQNSMNKKRP